METVGWIKRDYETNTITSRSKIHILDKWDNNKTVCNIDLSTVSYHEMDDGCFNYDYCKKCEKKYYKE